MVTQTRSSSTPHPAAPDWASVRDEVTRLLQGLLRHNTVNPPGNELACARYLAAFLGEHGVDATILEASPGRANLVARVQGAGHGRPLLLFSHFDTVPVERERWTQDPFAGSLVDGYIYGRGAVDMKQMIAMSALTLVLLKRHGIVPPRDVIMGVVADEEVGGEHGADWLVTNHPDLIRAEYALNEVGGFTIHIAGRKLYPIEVAEKGGCRVLLRAEGEPGHASVPNPDSAPAKLGRAVYRLATTPLPQHNTPAAVAFLRTFARALPFPASLAVRALLNRRVSPLALAAVGGSPAVARAISASLRNTATPTILQAAVKSNVIPSVAMAEVDGRVLPGMTHERFRREVQDAAGPGVTVETSDFFPGIAWEIDTPLFRRLGETLRRLDPAAVPVPWLNPAITDSRFLARLGITCYGFVPTPLQPGESFASLFHGHDERISVDALLFGTRAIFDVASGF